MLYKGTFTLELDVDSRKHSLFPKPSAARHSFCCSLWRVAEHCSTTSSSWDRRRKKRLTECSSVMQTYISPAHFQINFFICIPSLVHMGSGCWYFYSKTLRNVAILSRPRSLNVTFKGSSGAELRLAFSFQSLSQQPTCI